MVQNKKPLPATPPSRQRGASVTSVDVARAAGVSQSVVSRAFSLHPSVAEQTRADIFAVADRLGYRPNLLARSLITRKSNLFALVTGALANPLLLNVIDTFTQAAQAQGYRVLLFTSPRGEQLDTALLEVLQYQPHGVIALAGNPSDAMAAKCRESGIGVVLLGRDSDQPLVPSVSCDNFAAGLQVGELLVAAGHRRFAFITSREATLSFSERRQSGFTRALQQAGLGPPVVLNGGSTYEGGHRAALELLAQDAPPDAIFCASDSMALGVLDAARYTLSLQVPKDLSVVGFDDVPMAAWAGYELTTVRQPVPAMVQAALSLLLGQERHEGPASRLVPSELVLRRSTRLPAGRITRA